MKNEENLRIPENRELTAEEISLLRWLLENGLPETRNLLPQLKDVRVVSRCGCGCPTIDLQVLGTKPRASAIAQIVADFIGKTPEGMEVGVILRSQEGNLVELEVYCFGENEGRFNLPLIESLQDFPKSKPH